MASGQIPYSRDELFNRNPLPPLKGRHLDEVAFPLGGITTAEDVLVEGGTAGGNVTSVTINGQPVQTDDQFAHFRLRVPLIVGENALVVGVEDATGCLEPRSGNHGTGEASWLSRETHGVPYLVSQREGLD